MYLKKAGLASRNIVHLQKNPSTLCRLLLRFSWLYFSLKSWLCCCSLASLVAQQLSLIVNHCFLLIRARLLSQSIYVHIAIVALRPYESKRPWAVRTQAANRSFNSVSHLHHGGRVWRLFSIIPSIIFVGVRFVSISSFACVIKRFVRRENPERELQLKKKKFSDTSGEENSMFVAETASLLELCPELSKEDTEVFKTSFHDFSVKLWHPYRSDSCKQIRKLPNVQKTFVATGQRVEKDSLKRIALKLISCYLQKIRQWDCLWYGNAQT